MENYFIYIFKLTACLTGFYLFYRFVLIKDYNFKLLRYYFLFSILLSFVLAGTDYSIELEIGRSNDLAFEMPEQTTMVETNLENANTDVFVRVDSKSKIIAFNWKSILIRSYFIIVGILLIKLLITIGKLVYYYLTCKKKRLSEFTIIYLKDTDISFSFFGWIFLGEKMGNKDEISTVIVHESIHASQYHSIDILIGELLSAVMWFNPIIWFIRRTLRQLHEYLADDGVLGTGIDKLQYQALLLNQVAEGKLLSVSSGLNPALPAGRHSLIKKRIVMMTKTKFNQQTKLKVLGLIPMAIILFVVISCINQGKKDLIGAVSPDKMNVLYLGVDNPISIAVSGVDSDDMEIIHTNGELTGSNGKYIMRPRRLGNSVFKIVVDGDTVLYKEFRIKMVPDPVAMVARKRGGSIPRSKLLDAGRIEAVLLNFDFDLNFEIVSFTLSGNIDGFFVEHRSGSNQFTENQIELIKETWLNGKLYFEDIKAKGPDGAIRSLPLISFKVDEE